MAYRRRYTTRRRPRRTRRMLMRRRPRRTLSRFPKTYHFKRTFTGTPIASNTTATFGAYALQFGQLSNSTEFTALFDMYRVNKIVVKFVPNHNSSEVGATKAIPNFHTVLDFTDNSTPTTLAELYEYQSWRMTRGTAMHTRAFIPAVLQDAQEAASSGGALPKLKQWISTAQTDVYFYGIKYGAEASAAAGDVYWTPYITYYYSCKSVK